MIVGNEIQDPVDSLIERQKRGPGEVAEDGYTDYRKQIKIR